MKIRYPLGILSEPLTNPGLRFGLTLIITLMVMSSPIVMLVNPALIAAPDSTDGNTLAPSTMGQDGSDFTTQAALSSLTARPTNNIVNTNSFYDVVFLTATAGAIKTIQVTFPAGTTIPSSAFFNEAEKCVPSSNCTELTGTASKSGQTITYTVNNAVNVPAGTKIRLEFANINNPIQVSANYKVTVTTRNAANTPIDGPTQSTAYTMKQIGVNVIADSAITTQKVAPSLMKTVTLNDNEGGHARGWNPGGGNTIFTILEPDALEFVSFVTIEVRDGGSVFFHRECDVTGHGGSPTNFVVICDTPPNENSVLQYMVETPPSSVVPP